MKGDVRMIETAKRVLPGVVVSMMLATPALATTDTTAGTQGPKPAQTESVAGRGQSQRVKAANRRVYAMRHTVRHAYVSPLVRHAGYVPSRQTAFVNDAVAWSEPGRGLADGVGGKVQTGMASWYGGSRWNGHRTANGEVYRDNDLTAAHMTLPIGSLVRVTVLDTGRSVVVRINDRIGTHHRVIDLSRAAAAALDIEGRGVAMVALVPE
jgi:rare lipoprotein A (peptidoglycan hydrolase)